MPIRTRLTLVFAGLMALVLAASGLFLYARFQADLRDAVDTALRSRLQALIARVGEAELGLAEESRPIEPDESFAQILSVDGTVLDASPGLEPRALIPASTLSGLAGPRYFESIVTTPEEPVPARLLAAPFEGGFVVVVGASLEDLNDALASLSRLLWLGGPVALVLTTIIAWLLAGAALRPVERMRAEADALSASEPGRRLPVPATRDEVALLGETLNRMLARLEEGLERERRFVGDASHELRTPLANLKAEIELALRRSRTREELLEALGSAGHEADRLVRLAEDLLVLARADRGRLPANRELVDVAELAASEVSTFLPRASERGVVIDTRIHDGLRAGLDPLRFRQALGNLIDNAIRHSPPGGKVGVEVQMDGSWLRLEVTDAGDGFPDGFLPGAFEPFARADLARSRSEGGTGLGLAIVRAVAEAHGGTTEARNLPQGGASVVLTIRV